MPHWVGDLELEECDILNDVDSNHFSTECSIRNRCTKTRSMIFCVCPVHVSLNFLILRILYHKFRRQELWEKYQISVTCVFMLNF